MEKEIWIALLHVRQRPGAEALLDRNEAFTNALAAAVDRNDFRNRVRSALDQIGFDLVSWEDPEPLRTRLQRFEVSDEIAGIAQAVREDDSTRFSTFDTWIRDDDPEESAR